MKKINLTSKKLQLIIAEEREKLKSLGLLGEKQAHKESLNKLSDKLNHFKRLSIKEIKLQSDLKQLKAIKRKLAKNILKNSRI